MSFEVDFRLARCENKGCPIVWPLSVVLACIGAKVAGFIHRYEYICIELSKSDGDAFF